jgi:hypothetical protein
MMMSSERQKLSERLRAQLEGARRPLMGVSHSKSAWIRPEGALAVAHARVGPLEVSSRGRHAYERRNCCWKP